MAREISLALSATLYSSLVTSENICPASASQSSTFMVTNLFTRPQKAKLLGSNQSQSPVSQLPNSLDLYSHLSPASLPAPMAQKISSEPTSPADSRTVWSFVGWMMKTSVEFS